MNTTVSAWGNSLGVRIPKSYAVDLGIENGSPIDIIRTGNSIVIKAKKENHRKKYKIEDLAKQMKAKKAVSNNVGS